MKYSEIQIITTKITSIAFCYLFYRTTDRTDNISYAKSQASSSWDDYFESHPSRFCTCGNNKTWNYSTSIDVTCSSHDSLVTAASVKVTYNNPCGSSKSGTVGVSNGYSTVASRSITIPTGSGTKTENFNWTGGQRCGQLSATGGGSGSC